MERVRKEDWGEYNPFEDILGVELENGLKHYLQPNCDGFVPVNLKSLTDSSYSDTADLECGFEQLYDKGKKLYKFDSMSEMVEWATS